MSSQELQFYLPRFTLDVPPALHTDSQPSTAVRRAALDVSIEGRLLLTTDSVIPGTARLTTAESVPREQISAPISRSTTVTDTLIFETAVDPTHKYYLPRYRLAEQVVSGQTQFRMALEKGSDGGTLSLDLESYPASEIEEASRTATALDHRVDVALRYRVLTNNESNVQEELVFQEVTSTAGNVHAVLRVESLAKLTQLFSALTDSRYEPALVVRRTSTIAVPVEVIVASGEDYISQPDAFDIDAGLHAWGQSNADFTYDWSGPEPNQHILQVKRGIYLGRMSVADFEALSIVQLHGLNYTNDLVQHFDDDLTPGDLNGHVFALVTDTGNYGKIDMFNFGDVVRVRWTTYQPPPMFREVVCTLDNVLDPQPFVFPPSMHPYIFRNVDGSGAGSFGFIQRAVEWKQLFYSYYQDEAHPQVFKYLPDSFKLARRPSPPYYPAAAVTFTQNDGSLDQMQVTLDYKAAPFVERERLAAAATTLVNYLPTNSTPETNKVVFEPLVPGPNSTRLLIKLPGVNAEEHIKAIIDLRSGINDTLTLPMEVFKTVFDALISKTSSFFNGWVEVDVGNKTEQIPFLPRMDDLVGELFTYEIVPDTSSSKLQVTLHNAIESPLLIRTLEVQLQRGEFKVAGSIQGLTLPINLAPDAAVSLIVEAASPLDGEGDIKIAFNLMGIEVLPNKETVYSALLNAKVSSQYTRTITVQAVEALFENSQIEAFVIDFEHGDSVKLTPDALEVQAKVRLPIEDYILDRPSQGQYRYSMTIVRKDGQKQRVERSDSTGILFIDIKGVDGPE